jgi:hypothetical protein
MDSDRDADARESTNGVPAGGDSEKWYDKQIRERTEANAKRRAILNPLPATRSTPMARREQMERHVPSTLEMFLTHTRSSHQEPSQVVTTQPVRDVQQAARTKKPRSLASRSKSTASTGDVTIVGGPVARTTTNVPDPWRRMTTTTMANCNFRK